MYSKELKNEVLKYLDASSIENTIRKYGISKSVLFRWTNPDKTKVYNAQQLAHMKQYISNNKETYSLSQKKQYIKNQQKRTERQRNFYHANKEECAIKHKEWELQNKEHLSEYFKEYYSDETVKNRKKRWRAENKDKLHQYYLKHYNHKICLDRKRRARKNKVSENYTKEDEQYTRSLFFNKCAICGSLECLTIDHWYPLSLGHPLTRKNAVLMCRSCNSTKHDNMPLNIYDKSLVMLIESKLSNASV